MVLGVPRRGPKQIPKKYYKNTLKNVVVSQHFQNLLTISMLKYIIGIPIFSSFHIKVLFFTRITESVDIKFYTLNCFS